MFWATIWRDPQTFDEVRPRLRRHDHRLCRLRPWTLNRWTIGRAAEHHWTSTNVYSPARLLGCPGRSSLWSAQQLLDHKMFARSSIESPVGRYVGFHEAFDAPRSRHSRGQPGGHRSCLRESCGWPSDAGPVPASIATGGRVSLHRTPGILTSTPWMPIRRDRGQGAGISRPPHPGG